MRPAFIRNSEEILINAWRFDNTAVCYLLNHFARHQGAGNTKMSLSFNLIRRLKPMENISSFSLRHNEISNLMKIISFELKSFRNNRSPFLDNYFSTLSTVVDLGFAAVIIRREWYYVSVYQKFFNSFIDNCVKTGEVLFDHKIDEVAESTAKMIDLAHMAFKEIELPCFYDDFFTAFNELFKRLSIRADKEMIETAAQLSKSVSLPKSKYR